MEGRWVAQSGMRAPPRSVETRQISRRMMFSIRNIKPSTSSLDGASSRLRMYRGVRAYAEFPRTFLLCGEPDGRPDGVRRCVGGPAAAPNDRCHP